MQSEDALTELLIEEFEAKETPRCTMRGRQRHPLPFSKVKRVLQSLSDEMLSLSRLQISAVMSEAKTDEESEERMVDYTVFAPVAAYHLLHGGPLPPGEARRRGGEAVAVGRRLGSSINWTSFTIKEVIRHAFHEADVDGNATLDPEEMRTVLQALGSVRTRAQPRGDQRHDRRHRLGRGGLSSKELVDFLFDVLSHLERERYIQDNAFGRWEE